MLKAHEGVLFFSISISRIYDLNIILQEKTVSLAWCDDWLAREGHTTDDASSRMDIWYVRSEAQNQC
jgi:hypothetical protein